MRKLAADLIFDGYRLLRDKVLVVTDRGEVDAIVEKEAAGEDIAAFPGLLMPGMINTHCHLELSHLKDVVPEGTGLVPFLSGVTRLRNTVPEYLIQRSIEIADQQMWDNGIVAVGDIANGLHTTAIKQHTPLYYHTFVECIGFTAAGAANRYAYSKEVAGGFHALSLPATLVPHAPYSVSKELFGLINQEPGNSLLTIHNQESAAENEFYRSQTGTMLRLYEQLNIDCSFFEASGKSSLQTYLPYFDRQQKVVLVHNTFTSDEDIRFALLQGQDIYWCFCPNANLYIEKRLPEIDLFRNSNCRITLGTDSRASNHTLSILAEMKTIHRHFPDIPLGELLQWATLNGALALGIGERYGSFERGKCPGVIWIDNIENDHLKDDSNVLRIN